MIHLRLLGPPQLQTPSKTLAPDRRTAGVLAYLALEGTVHKYRLAGWLWPDSGEEAAKKKMRQLLRRLRLNAGDVVIGDDHTLEVGIQEVLATWKARWDLERVHRLLKQNLGLSKCLSRSYAAQLKHADLAIAALHLIRQQKQLHPDLSWRVAQQNAAKNSNISYSPDFLPFQPKFMPFFALLFLVVQSLVSRVKMANR